MILRVESNYKEKIIKDGQTLLRILPKSLHIVENQQDFYIPTELFYQPLKGMIQTALLESISISSPLKLCNYDELVLILKYRKEFLYNTNDQRGLMWYRDLSTNFHSFEIRYYFMVYYDSKCI